MQRYVVSGAHVTRRSERVAEEIREAAAHVIERELKDPRIGFVTVTRVTLTDDLRFARIMVGILGEEEQRQRSLSGLRKATGFVRRQVGRRIRTRYTPELVFEYDHGLDASDRVEELLREDLRARDQVTSQEQAGDRAPSQPPLPEPADGSDDGSDSDR